MKELTKKLLLMQGYNNEVICGCKNINVLARWTPLACATFGTLGLILGNSTYFIILGALTTIGAFSSRSFYDYIYNYLFRCIFKTEKTPLHGNQRRFGCGIGAILYILGGVGFSIGNLWLAYIPTVFMVSLAFIAAFTQWCFASTLYNAIFKTKTE
jgi:hypothetical protein